MVSVSLFGFLGNGLWEISSIEYLPSPTTSPALKKPARGGAWVAVNMKIWYPRLAEIGTMIHVLNAPVLDVTLY